MNNKLAQNLTCIKKKKKKKLAQSSDMKNAKVQRNHDDQNNKKIAVWLKKTTCSFEELSKACD